MRGLSFVFLATLFANASSYAANEGVRLNVAYPHHKGPCPQDVVNLLPLTLVYNISLNEHLRLVAIETPDATIGAPLSFNKEGLDGERAYMSIGSTDLNVNNNSYPLSQLWIEKEKGAPLVPGSSAFYVDKNKTCLIMHDLKAADNPLAKPR